MFPRLVTRGSIGKSISAVASIAADNEVDPGSVGVDPAAVDEIWHSVETLYRSGLHPAIQLCVRRRGEVLIDRAIGHAKGAGPNDLPTTTRVPVTTETPFNTFSASKAITAMLIHLLDQRGQLHLDDPVCSYIPEFAAHGKRWITIRHLLTHRAGIPNIPSEAMRLDLLAQPDEILKILCDAKPTIRAGYRLAYHAISGGFLLGEIVKRVTGKEIRTVLAEEILDPLGFRWTNYGVKPEDVDKVAVNYFTGLPILPPASWMFRRFLGVSFEQVTEMGNDPRYLTGVVPAGNIVSTANEMGRFYELLLQGGTLDGVRIFEPATIRRAIAEQSYLEFDLSLGLPLRYSMGFMLGGRVLSFFGPDTLHAFGHIGFVNVMGWADPTRRISVGLMTSGKPFIYPELRHLAAVTRQIGVACPVEKDFNWWQSLASEDGKMQRKPSKVSAVPRRLDSA